MKKTATKLISAMLSCLMLAAALSFSLTVHAQADTVRVTVVNDTYSTESGAPWTGTLVDTTVEIGESKDALSVIKTALESTATPHSIVESSWGGYYIAEINGISENDAAQYSGWMGLVNNWAVNDNLGNISVKDGDVITVAYSVTMGADIGADWMNASKSLKALSVSGAALDSAFSAAETEYTLTLEENAKTIKVVPTAENKYNQVRVYKNEYTPESDDYYRPTDDISVLPADKLYIGIGNEGWPGSSYGVDEKVYTLTVNYDEAAYSTGDVNLDGKTDVTDATLVQMSCAKLYAFNELQVKLANYDGNDKIDITDATLIQMAAAGIFVNYD